VKKNVVSIVLLQADWRPSPQMGQTGRQDPMHAFCQHPHGAMCGAPATRTRRPRLFRPSLSIRRNLQLQA